MLHVLKSRQTVFQSSYSHCTIPQVAAEGSSISTSLMTLVIGCYFYLSHFSGFPSGIPVLICISLLTSDGEHLFLGLLAMCMSSLRDDCSHPWLSFWSAYLCWYWAVKYFYTVVTGPLPGIAMPCRYFLSLGGHLFHFLDGVFWSTKVFNLDEDKFIFLFLLSFICLMSETIT